MARIEFKNDKTRAFEETEGSDGRLNVSSRIDSRRYYNSRDEGNVYSFVYNFEAAASTEFAFYIKNISTDKTLVISSVGMNSEVAARLCLNFVTGTAASGTLVTPSNSNKTSPHSASVIAMEGAAASTGITGLTDVGKIDLAWVQATGHEELRLDDAIRLGQNDAIALNVLETGGGDVGGVVWFYFE
jgi:hypothetical protein